MVAIETGMNHRLLYQWTLLLCVILLIIAGIVLKQRNEQLVKKNNLLILENDSILSVNILLQKKINHLHHTLDSVGNASTITRSKAISY